ncbi:hypothetical protein ACHHYP_09097 [Achlya hypogyna]|uniref:Uncharacterized protein n=1 Tax=Achlya hypogyna TaxID=1202772 RepID=A0A1V9YNT3_ACHHY|nr:hypothetical protein ACHHYP_09097 [Achlya hypogyna]
MLQRLDSGPLVAIVSFLPEPAQVVALLQACPPSALGHPLACLLRLATLLPPGDVWPELCVRSSTPVLAPLLDGVLGLVRTIRVLDLSATASVASALRPSTTVCVYDIEAPSNYQLVALQTFAAHLSSFALNLQSFSRTKSLAAATALPGCKQLTHLKLAWTGGCCPEPVLGALPHCHRLMRLSLGYTHISTAPLRLSPPDEELLESWLAVSPTLRHVELAAVVSATGQFARGLQRAKQLESIALANAPEFCVALLDGTPLPTGLRRLQLHCVGLKAADVPRLVSALEGASLETLQLSNNYLGVLGAVSLVPCLEQLHCLRALELPSIFLMDEGCTAWQPFCRAC